MIRVSITGGSPILRAGLTSFLELHTGIEIVDDTPDVMLLSFEPGSDLPEPPPPVVLLTDSAPPAVFREPGISALPAHPDSSDLVAAVEAAAVGLVVVHPSFLPLWTTASAAAEDLTARELEVLRMMADGLGNKQIGARLGISDHTAKFHVSAILGKLGVSSRTEAVAAGLRRGLVLL